MLNVFPAHIHFALLILARHTRTTEAAVRESRVALPRGDLASLVLGLSNQRRDFERENTERECNGYTRKIEWHAILKRY